MGVSLQCAAKSGTCAGNHRCEFCPACDGWMAATCLSLVSVSLASSVALVPVGHASGTHIVLGSHDIFK